MLKQLALAAGLMATACTATAPAYAQQPQCYDRTKVLEELERQYKEIPVAVGLANNGTAMEVFVSPSGTWTLVNTRPDGMSCPVAAGHGWESIPVPSPDPLA